MNTMKYEELPKTIRDRLFKIHTHAELIPGEEIVYREKDVLELISVLLNPKTLGSL